MEQPPVQKKNLWAIWRPFVAAFLALAIFMVGAWFLAPNRVKWQINFAFREMWRSLTENWGDKWDTVLQILGFDDTPAGARVAIACTQCDVCAAVINRYFHRYDPKDIKSLLRKTDLGPMVVDIRSVDEYEKGHIPGALPMPLPTLKEDIWSVNRKTPIIIVGNGNEDYRKIGDDIVEKWKFYNAGYLVGGMKVWDGDIEVEK